MFTRDRTLQSPPRAPSRARRRLLAGSLGLALAASAAAVAVIDPATWSVGGRAEASMASLHLMEPPRPGPVHIASAERLARLFERLDYRLDAVGDEAAPVPRIELAALPADLAEIAPVDRRKRLFIRAVLPVVLRANQAVLEERAELAAELARIEAGAPPSAEQRRRVGLIAARHGLEEAPADAADLRRLLDRVDAVPVSLAVAQAILESGWGTSRFALTGNALFGQWTWDEASGIVPAARVAGKSHRVRAFENLVDSARAYLFNLNTHPAYAGFREARAAARARDGALPPGRDLARHLTRYSERGAAYVDEIRAVIRQNRLDRLDGAELHEPARFADADPLASGLIDG